MISESRRFAISNVMLVVSIGLLAFVSMDSFGTGCANAATGSCQVGDTETFSADLGLGGDVIFEGATDDDFETSLTATDPTADRTITMPDYSGDLAVYTGGEGTATQVLTSNGPGVAPTWQNNITLPDYSTGIEFEGATDDAFETTLAITDPTADRIITVPDVDGTVAVASNAGAAGQVLVQTASGQPEYASVSAGTEEWWCIADAVPVYAGAGGGSSNYYYATAGNPFYGNKCQIVFTDPGTYRVEFEVVMSNRTGAMDYTRILCISCGTADTLDITGSHEIYTPGVIGSTCNNNNTAYSSPAGTSPLPPYSTTTIVANVMCSSAQRGVSHVKLSSTYLLNPGENIDFTNAGANGLGVQAWIGCSPYACSAGQEYVEFSPFKLHIIKIS